MTTCLTGVCGTGEPLVLPNDPSNNSILTATSAYGGIDLSWTLPAQNSHAIAHVGVFRGTTNVFANAMPIAMTANNYYRDNVGPGILYYYWIQIVSINGTYADPIGPASATAMSSIEKTIIDLSGLIDRGVLSNELKSEIDKITLNYAELTQEIANRIAGNAALSAALEDVQNGLADSVALVNQEITTRTDGQNALAQQMNIIAAVNAENAAAIIDEQTARVTADEALATQYNAVYAATQNNAAAVVAETNARVNADSNLANQITTVQSSLNNNIASVQTNLQTNINTVDGKVNNIGALYTVKVNVNGLAGGFGIYNNGTEIEAGFDVDRFFIGSSQGNKIKPFIVSGGVVYITQAAIKQLTFNKLTDETGEFVVENGKIRGAYLNVKGISVTNPGGVVTFSVAENGDAVFGGSLQGVTGTFSGSLTSGAINAVNTINLAGSSVTVPAVVSATNTVYGNGTGSTVLNQSIYLDYPGWVFAVVTCGINLGFGAKNMTAELYINGTKVSRISGTAETYGIAISGALYCPAGNIDVSFNWAGQDGQISIYDRTMYVQGAKR